LGLAVEQICYNGPLDRIKPKVNTMVEFTSEPQKTFRPVTMGIALGILAVVLGGGYLYIHYQGRAQQRTGAVSVVVPGLLGPGNSNFEYYKTRIRIENLKASLGVSFNNARIAMISGIIVNDGDRKLEALQLHITLYDVFGKVSKERTAFALRPGAGYSGKPMEPLEKRPFAIGVESVEYYWDPKQITFEITGLKYQ
jgi:hypothetical protein